MMNIPEYVRVVLDRLKEKGYEAYLVGGCVRDMLMGKKPHDYDVTTNAMPEETMNCFSRYNLVTAGLKHGTVGIIIDKNVIEVTTYRIDGEYKDSRHPESVEFTRSLEDDLRRRDFTINAIAYDGGETVDIFGGRNDIENGIIRCVGNAEKRFNEDALRILRGLRFSSVLGFSIDTETGNAMRRCSELLKSISAERIYDEFSKLICGSNVKNVLLEYSDIFSVIIPELKSMIGFDQKNKHHCYDVYTHSVVAVENCPQDMCLRMAALFHDIGKPDCFTVDDEGVGHFYGHSKISEKKAHDVLKRFKASNKDKSLICELVALHDREIVCRKNAVKRFMSKVSEDVLDRIFDLKRADIVAQAPECRERIKVINQTEKLMNEIIKEKECFSLKDLAISGRDLISAGFPPSKEMGLILNRLLLTVIDGQLENSREPLLEKAASIREELLQGQKAE